MSGQKYKRTNFEEDDNSLADGTPPGGSYDPAIAFKVGATFCHRRSPLERLLLALVAILALVALVLAVLLGSHNHPSSDDAKQPPHSPSQSKEGLCTTKVCVTVASSMLNSMDESVSPCSDFYQYACGGWMKAHPIPSGESRWDTFGVLRRANQIVLKNVLESPLNESQSEAEKKAKLYYISCLDINKTVENLGAAPLLNLMRELGGWSVSSSSGVWDASKWNFQQMLEKIHSLGLSNFFSMWVAEDEKNPTKNILQFDQGGIILLREQYLNKTVRSDKILSAYLKYMTGTGVLLGGERNETERLMAKVVEFEQAIANITVPQEDRRDDEKMYNKKTIADLQKIAPFIEWKDYVNHLLNVTNVRVTSSEQVLIYEQQYFEQMSRLVLETLNAPDGKIILHNYMMWHVVKMMSTYLSKPFQDVKKDFIKVMSGVSGDEEQWRYCTSDIDNVIGFAVGAMFVRETFHGESKASAEVMIAGVKEAFVENLPKLKWMDIDTRKAAVEKANAVVDMIGFPEFILNSTQLDNRYKELEIHSDEYFLNNYRALLYTMKRNFDKLRQPPDKSSWIMTPPTVNAYYTPTKNQIVFPAGILQAPFYDKDYPRSLNYGAMGVVMGHELTHGFDDQGREYDKMGVLRPWWNQTSVDNFKQRAQCMMDQYSKYSASGENLKGKQTLGENIADNGGLKSAYHAYEQWVAKNGEEPLLPGLNFTHRQLFYLAFAQVWCTNSRVEDSHNSILSDAHSLPRFRVIGPISNSYEFAELFKCPANSPMNPTNKCEVW